MVIVIRVLCYIVAAEKWKSHLFSDVNSYLLYVIVHLIFVSVFSFWLHSHGNGQYESSRTNENNELISQHQ